MSRNLSLALKSLPGGMRMGRERRVIEHVPYSALVAPDIIETVDGDLVAIIALRGVSHQTADTASLNAWLASRAHVIQTIASPDVGLYYTYIRRRVEEYPEAEFTNSFARDLDDAWAASIAQRRQYLGEHYLSVILRTDRKKTFGVFTPKAATGSDGRIKAIARLRDILRGLTGGLADYGPRILKVESGCSEALAFLGYLLSGQHRSPLALPNGPVGDAIASHRISFGAETIEFRGTTPASDRLATIVSVKEYTPETAPGMLDDLAPIPAEFIVTQSFAPVARDKALTMMSIQKRKMAVAEDDAVSLSDQLSEAQDDVASGRSVLGKHHMTVTVFGEDARTLLDTTSEVTTALTEIGLTPVREDTNLEAAFWASLPGNFAYAARAAEITSTNLAGLMSLHSYPAGAQQGHWGPPITLFETITATPYRFHLHVRDVGNTVLFGPTGSGKTALLSFLIAQSERVKPRIIVIDKDRGIETLVRALGGRYIDVEPGTDARLNPFLIADGETDGKEAETRAFLRSWLTVLLYTDEKVPPNAVEAIRIAIDQVRDAPREARRLELLAESLGGGAGGAELLERLRGWISGGERAWAFNSADDRFGDLFAERIVGIDVTKILDDKTVRAPWMMYLFHQIEEAMTSGERTLVVLDEAWKLLSDEIFAQRIQDWLKTIRKRNGAVIFATQEPEDATRSAVGRTIISQSPTRLLLPNPRASEEAYIAGLGITPMEYDIVKRTPAASRLLLICHDSDSVVARFDLSELSEYLKVLSARAETINEAHALMHEHGEHPDDWLPKFIERTAP